MVDEKNPTPEEKRLADVNGAVGACWQQLDEQTAVLDSVLLRLNEVRVRIKDTANAMKLSLPPPPTGNEK